MSDLHFHGIWRMDWGLGNPNKTGALIAILMVAAWFLALWRRKGFWVALALCTGLGICLIHTMSRGAVIALFAGLIPLIMAAPRPWGRAKVVGVVVAVWVIVGASLYLNAGERLGQGIVQEDRSITNRFQIWKAAPRMMVDAPGGWGIGNSGSAYMQWYQPLVSHESYRTLVNSHLTWMVEMGWPLRVAYLLGWGAVLLLCWPGASSRWLAVPLGVWSTFFVAAAFSSVAESPWLWIVPGVSLIAVFGYRIRCRIWPAGRLCLIPIGVSLLICGVLAVLGMRHSSTVHKQGGVIVCGHGKPQVWILPDTKVMGTQWGRTLRKLARKSPSCVGVVLDAGKMPLLKGEHVVITGSPLPVGKLAEVMATAGKVMLVNPRFYPQEVGFDPARMKVELVVGEFSDSPAVAVWKEKLPAKVLPGVGDYLPDWKVVMGNPEKP
jgi:O-Antigen ligase